MSNKMDVTNMEQETKQGIEPKLRFPEFRDTVEWENEPLKEAWCEVFCLCAVELSIEYLAVEVLPSIFTMFTMKNPLPIRIRSTKMILSIAKVSPLKF